MMFDPGSKSIAGGYSELGQFKRSIALLLMVTGGSECRTASPSSAKVQPDATPGPAAHAPYTVVAVPMNRSRTKPMMNFAMNLALLGQD